MAPRGKSSGAHHYLTKSEKKKLNQRKKKNQNGNATKKAKSTTPTVSFDFQVQEIFEDASDLDDQYKQLRGGVIKSLGPLIKGVNYIPTAKTIQQKIHDSFDRFQSSGACADATFTLFDLTSAILKYKQWINALPRINAFYAMKCNPDPLLVKTLVGCGAGLDCASMMEIKAGIETGLSPDNIIFANPCKMQAHIQYAKEKGVRMMTFDNKQELTKVHSIFPEAKMVLRILGDDSHSVMQFGTKFGARVSTEARSLLEHAYSLGLEVCGVSFHVGSGCMSPEGFVNSLRLARQVFDMAEELGRPMNFLDIGGGFPGTDSEDLKFADIAAAISETVEELFPDPSIRVIAEPGRYFAHECVVLVTSVISRRERTVPVLRPAASLSSSSSSDLSIGSDSESDEPAPIEEEPIFHYYISDGVYGSFNNLFFDHAKAEPVGMSRPGANSDLPSLPPQRSILFGPTCDSIDVVCDNIWLPPMEIGDLIYFFNMGAYTSAAASSFNGFAPPKPHYMLC
eukprot:TRINITY_DN467_c0_g1_i7.p2 TRINITY_DN467_c0_g1~~TRINITY_DN467_c0_g1_i7.p2  ORF type:complete len:511 (-),score=276.99 TRINITY_DN467_c0_g1_i7:261-1793(-)